MNDVREALQIKIESPYWDEAYKQALSEPEVPAWLTVEYLRNLHNECDILPKSIETLVSVAPYVAAVPELCLLAKTLYHILATKKGFNEAFTHFELPKAPETAESTAGYDCVAIFPVIAHLRPTWDGYKERGVADDILTPSLRWADNIFSKAVENAGKPVFNEASFQLYSVVIYTNSLIIGRLRFEIYENSARPVRIFKNKKGELCPLMDDVVLHKSGHILGSGACTDEEGSFPADFVETEDAYEGYSVDEVNRLAAKQRVRLLKSEWQQVYASGETAIKVHIPYGGKMTKEACEESYMRAREVFNRCFPEYHFTCFLICCWMLSPELKDILPPESNIIAFQNHYMIYPMKNNALDAFLYVFGIEDKALNEIAVADLPENNTMQRGVKQKSLEGKYIHQFGGYMPW